MRFGKSPKPGDRRVVTRFLFLPKKLKGQWRWLEIANIVQECEACYGGTAVVLVPSLIERQRRGIKDFYRWRSLFWLDKTQSTGRI